MSSPGGSSSFTKGRSERIGSWEQSGENALRVTLDGQDYERASKRQNLRLTLNLPGESQETAFTQM